MFNATGLEAGQLVKMELETDARRGWGGAGARVPDAHSWSGSTFEPAPPVTFVVPEDGADRPVILALDPDPILSVLPR